MLGVLYTGSVFFLIGFVLACVTVTDYRLHTYARGHTIFVASYPLGVSRHRGYVFPPGLCYVGIYSSVPASGSENFPCRVRIASSHLTSVFVAGRIGTRPPVGKIKSLFGLSDLIRPIVCLRITPFIRISSVDWFFLFPLGFLALGSLPGFP